MTRFDEDMEPVLLLLMRTDMDSMNAGKAMAQANHAGSAFAHCMESDPENLHYKKWRAGTNQGFGTVLTLDGFDERSIQQEVNMANGNDCIADMIHDPTYPIKDGDVTHLLPINTCAYIFGDRNSDMIKDLLNRYPLHS